MTARDKVKLQELLLRLTAHFSDPLKQTIVIGRGEARATVAAIRELSKRGENSLPARPRPSA